MLLDVFGVITGDWGVETTKLGKKKRDIRIADQQKQEVLLCAIIMILVEIEFVHL